MIKTKSSLLVSAFNEGTGFQSLDSGKDMHKQCNNFLFQHFEIISLLKWSEYVIWKRSFRMELFGNPITPLTGSLCFLWLKAHCTSFLVATFLEHSKQNVCLHGNIFGADIFWKQIGHSNILEIDSILNILIFHSSLGQEMKYAKTNLVRELLRTR